MYYVKNNILCNNKRQKINKDKCIDLIKNTNYNKLLFSNVIYNNYNILELLFKRYVDDKIYRFKYFIEFDNYNNLVEFKNILENIKK